MEFISSIRQSLFQPVEHQRLTSWLFLKLLALIYLAAFASLMVQIDGLVGPQGIMPFSDELARTYLEKGGFAWVWYPVIYWLIEPTNTVLVGTTWIGMAFSLLLLSGRWQRTILITLFVLYLSLFHAGQYFTNFQWDTLLLEIGFLAIFLVDGPNRFLVLLFEWLLFRLRFMSGVFKLVSGDPSWSGFTALNYYFETQPLPHVGAWCAHHLPDWMLNAGVGLTFFGELIVPFFIFLPRPFRLSAAGITITLQLLIIATSNHNFINLMTIVLCVFLLDDQIVGRILPARLKAGLLREKSTTPSMTSRFGLTIAFLLIVPTSVVVFAYHALREPLPPVVQSYSDAVRRLGLGNIYHVFPTMQTERQELVVQGSRDGKEWLDYEFRYKPGSIEQVPSFIVPHQPRLDWLIWFVPTQAEPHMVWFGEFLQRLHEGEPSVVNLLAVNPFPDKPPQYLRVLAYRYHFTSPEEKENTGNWWKREYIGVFPWVSPRRP